MTMLKPNHLSRCISPSKNGDFFQRVMLVNSGGNRGNPFNEACPEASTVTMSPSGMFSPQRKISRFEAQQPAKFPDVGWFFPTHLKNMRKSKWVHLPQIGVKIPKIFELPPPSFNLYEPGSKLLVLGINSSHL